MRVERTVVFDICSFWHAGTGRGAGTGLDATVFRSPAGLPLLPGRTVRGLLRDALARAERLGAVDGTRFEGGAATWCFGTALDARPDRVVKAGDDRVRALEEARFRTCEGKLEVTSAVIGETPEQARRWEAWAAQPENGPLVENLFRGFASTKVGKDGTAKPHTLRSVEVVVPLVLHARVSGPGDGPPWWDALAEAVKLIRGLGSHRNRGLGRVQVRLEGTR